MGGTWGVGKAVKAVLTDEWRSTDAIWEPLREQYGWGSVTGALDRAVRLGLAEKRKGPDGWRAEYRLQQKHNQIDERASPFRHPRQRDAAASRR